MIALFITLCAVVVGLLFWALLGAVERKRQYRPTPPTELVSRRLYDSAIHIIASLLKDVRAQQRANRIKKRKLRALRAEVKRLRKAINDTYQLDQS